MILKNILRKIILVIGVFLIPFYANAQLKKNIEYSGFFDTYYFRGPTIFTFGTGLNLYEGDLCSGFGCHNITPNISLSAGYQVWPGVVFGGEFTNFKLKAIDVNKDRGITFKSSNYELMGFARYYLRRDIVRRHVELLNRPKVFKPYVMLGMAGLVYNPKATHVDSTGATVRVDETYSGITFAIPAGIGASFVISHRIQLMTELTYRYTFSDYLDGVGKNYGNEKIKDGYLTFNVKVAYAPKAPRLYKKKRKYSPPTDGTEEEGEGGENTGGGETPKKAAPDKSKPSDDEPSDDAPMDDVPMEDKPAESSPAEEDGFEEDSFDNW